MTFPRARPSTISPSTRRMVLSAAKLILTYRLFVGFSATAVTVGFDITVDSDMVRVGKEAEGQQFFEVDVQGETSVATTSGTAMIQASEGTKKEVAAAYKSGAGTSTCQEESHDDACTCKNEKSTAAGNHCVKMIDPELAAFETATNQNFYDGGK